MTGLNLGVHTERDCLFAGESRPTADSQVVVEFAGAAENDISATSRIPLTLLVAWFSQIEGCGCLSLKQASSVPCRVPLAPHPRRNGGS
jgi:hypothetical protein